MTTRDEQRLSTRTAVLRAAAEEFDARGYAAVTLNDIARRLGLTKGAIFFHFPSKADLAVAVVEEYVSSWRALRDELAATGLRGFDALHWLLRHVAEIYRDDARARVPLRLMRESDVIGADLPAPFVAWTTEVARHLEEALADGEARADLAVEDVAWHVVASFFGVQEVSHHRAGRADLVSRVEAMWSLLLPALRPH